LNLKRRRVFMVGSLGIKERGGLTARLVVLAVENRLPAEEVTQLADLPKPCVILQPRKKPAQNV
jgi:hypothetical protein